MNTPPVRIARLAIDDPPATVAAARLLLGEYRDYEIGRASCRERV